MDYSPGLRGVVAGETEISTVGMEGTSLRYRGYDAIELTKTQTYEDVASLIIDHGAVDGAYRSGDNWSASEVAEHEGYDHIVEWFELGERSARTYKRASRKEQIRS